MQTRDGYMWLATADGLVRYDGVRFTVFNTANTAGIKSNRCNSLLEDEDGRLWVGTEEGGIICYDRGAFVTYTTDDGLPNNFIQGIQGDAEGGVIIATGGGIVRWHGGKLTPLFPGGPAGYQRDVYFDRSGPLWRADGTALYVLNRGRPLTIRQQDGLSSLKVTAMIEDRQGALWIGTQNAGLNRFKDGRIEVFAQKDGLIDGGISALLEDREGTIWIGVVRKGLVRFTAGRFSRYTTAEGLSDNIVISLYEDREGNLWAGTMNGGLNRLNRELVTTLSTRDGLAADNIYPILEDRTGDVWIGN